MRFCVLSFLLSTHLLAQPVLIPLQTQPVNTKVCKNLTLPFFDDFSSGTDSNWFENKGALINNSLALQAPSIFVASFDGLDGKGIPYNVSEPARVAFADSLVSHCFDLKAFSAADSLILSFFVQPGGLGELPNEEDSLILIAKERSGSWSKIWGSAPDSVLDFKWFEIKLLDTSFFHSDFQFAFVNIARTSGPFDVWNLDYVHFYSKKQDVPRLRFDIAVASPFSRLLGNYRAMPLSQFRAQAIEDSCFIEIHNLSQELKLIAHPVVLRQYEEVDSVLFLVRSKDVETFSKGSFESDKSINLIDANQRLEVRVPLEYSWMRNDLDSCWIEAEIALNTQETNQIIATTANDTLRYRAAIKDFFAYDDGSAEYGLGMRQRFGKLAIRFILKREALLTDIDLYFPRIGVDQEGQIYRLCVWKHIDFQDSRNDKQIFVQTRTVHYSEKLNQFQRLNLIPPVYKLEDLLILQDTFYIGIQQLTEKMLPLGFDENTDSQNDFFYNIGTKWEKNSNIPGSIMIRPVFRRDAVQVGMEADILDLMPPFPNPTSGALNFDGSFSRFTKIKIFDLQGRIVFLATLDENHHIDVSSLSSGCYVLEVFDHEQTSRFKIIKY